MSEDYRFAFDRPSRVLLLALGVTPWTSWVRLDNGKLEIRFGPWRLVTPEANIAGVQVTGPYRWVKAIGARLSLADRGITFGTNARRGVCIRFHTPIPGLLGHRIMHPAVTVTVAEPEALAARLR